MTDEEERPDDDDDGIPWASPEIQIAYEAALGQFMLAFNRLDNKLAEIIETVLLRLNRSDLVKACIGRDFWSKLLAADLLRHSNEGAGIINIPISAMREIATHRNKVAHGHFDQDPYSGDYDIVVKNVRATYSVEDLDRQTTSATQAWDALRYAEAFYAFSETAGPPS